MLVDWLPSVEVEDSPALSPSLLLLSLPPLPPLPPFPLFPLLPTLQISRNHEATDLKPVSSHIPSQTPTVPVESGARTPCEQKQAV